MDFMKSAFSQSPVFKQYTAIPVPHPQIILKTHRNTAFVRAKSHLNGIHVAKKIATVEVADDTDKEDEEDKELAQFLSKLSVGSKAVFGCSTPGSSPIKSTYMKASPEKVVEEPAISLTPVPVQAQLRVERRETIDQEYDTDSSLGSDFESFVRSPIKGGSARAPAVILFSETGDVNPRTKMATSEPAAPIEPVNREVPMVSMVTERNIPSQIEKHQIDIAAALLNNNIMTLDDLFPGATPEIKSPQFSGSPLLERIVGDGGYESDDKDDSVEHQSPRASISTIDEGVSLQPPKQQHNIYEQQTHYNSPHQSFSQQSLSHNYQQSFASQPFYQQPVYTSPYQYQYPIYQSMTPQFPVSPQPQQYVSLQPQQYVSPQSQQFASSDPHQYRHAQPFEAWQKGGSEMCSSCKERKDRRSAAKKYPRKQCFETRRHRSDKPKKKVKNEKIGLKQGLKKMDEREMTESDYLTDFHEFNDLVSQPSIGIPDSLPNPQPTNISELASNPTIEMINELLLGQVRLVEQFVAISRRVLDDSGKSGRRYRYTTLEETKRVSDLLGNP